MKNKRKKNRKTPSDNNYSVDDTFKADAIKKSKVKEKEKKEIRKDE
jgi:hypothetical protein